MKLIKRRLIFPAALAVVMALCASLYAEQQSSLSAFTINYNSKTGEVHAAGDVELTKGRSVVRGETGYANSAAGVLEVGGQVSGVFPEYNLELKSADSLKWTEERAKNSRGLIEARGRVNLVRGVENSLQANYVSWVPDTENYLARGNVYMHYGRHILEAAEARRTSTTFYGIRVTRYEDTLRKTRMAADRVDGKIKNGEAEEITAVGNVAVRYTDPDGLTTNLTGAKAVYSKALGTVVVSGGAKAVRGDGKTVSAEKMILYVDTNNVEAVGNARVSFTADGGGKGKSKKNGASD